MNTMLVPESGPIVQRANRLLANGRHLAEHAAAHMEQREMTQEEAHSALMAAGVPGDIAIYRYHSSYPRMNKVVIDYAILIAFDGPPRIHKFNQNDSDLRKLVDAAIAWAREYQATEIVESDFYANAERDAARQRTLAEIQSTPGRGAQGILDDIRALDLHEGAPVEVAR